MNRALKSALIELRSEGVELDPVTDLEHILTLDKLSRKMMAPAAGNDSAVLEPVLKVGNVTLRHLSLGAQRFVTEVVAEWIPDDAYQQDLAYVFCMCHQPEELWALQRSRSEFLKAVKGWTRTVNVSTDRLRAEVREFLAVRGIETPATQATLTPGDYRRALGTLAHLRPIPEQFRMECEAALVGMSLDDEGGSYGPLLEILCREYGHDADHWLWRVSRREVDMLMTQRSEKLEAEIRAIKGAQDDRLLRAHHAFVEYQNLVRRIKKGAK